MNMNTNTNTNTNVIEASGLGKRYGSTWALRDCTLAIPAGHVVAVAAAFEGVLSVVR